MIMLDTAEMLSPSAQILKNIYIKGSQYFSGGINERFTVSACLNVTGPQITTL